MKDTETKLAFIKARAEGKSYSTIGKELGISKATCTSWEHQLRAEIEQLENEQTEELYTAYHMKRDARIKDLGETLQRIDTALQGKDLSQLSATALLNLKLQYTRELRTEYTEPVEVNTDNTLDGLVEQCDRLLRDAMAGKYSPAEVKAQLAILDAKKDAVSRLVQEQERDGKALFEPLEDFDTPQYSRLIRHEDSTGREQ